MAKISINVEKCSNMHELPIRSKYALCIPICKSILHIILCLVILYYHCRRVNIANTSTVICIVQGHVCHEAFTLGCEREKIISYSNLFLLMLQKSN